MVEVTFSWPPSVNTYWRRVRDRFYIAKKGIEFRSEVVAIAGTHRGYFSEQDRIKVEIKAYPPDNRRRDLDNVLKSLLDSLQYAGVYKDDNQINDLHIIRCSPNEGKVVVTLTHQLPR